MKILIISPDYPNKYRSSCTFVKQLVDEFARQGHECCVIAPYNKSHNRKSYPYIENQIIDNNSVQVYRPWYISFSDIKIFGRHITTVFYQFAVNRALKDLNFKPDILYGHFWRSAAIGLNYAKRHKLPIITASGESDIRKTFDDFEHFAPVCKEINGVVCVSTKNKDESISLGLTTEDKCKVFPNAIDNNLFFNIDKKEARKVLGLPIDKFIVIFVGTFKESKGPDRLSQAISSIKENDVYSIFIGGGNVQPTCDNILFKGRLFHEQIPLYLNAADVFVLPTRAEGCCNAIIEAMACGLPIISSNLPFNWDVLNERNSILVDPDNIDEIANAICLMKNNKKTREQMSEESFKTAQSLTISQRAGNIISFMKEYLINEHNEL